MADHSCPATLWIVLLVLVWTFPAQADSFSRTDRSKSSKSPWFLDVLEGPRGTTRPDRSYAPTYNGSNVHVYILGQGTIMTNHSEFGNRADNAWAVPGSEGCSTAMTSIASVVGGNRFGSAKNVRIHGMSVVPCQGIAYTDGVAGAMQWIRDNAERPSIVLTTISSRDAPFRLSTAVYFSTAMNIPVIAAAGFVAQNECGWWPGGEADITTVGAVDIALDPTTLSNKGSCLSLFAPGKDILSAGASKKNVNENIVMQGTAHAAALSAGLAAQYLQANPFASNTAVNRYLNRAALPGVIFLEDGSQSPNAFLHYNQTLLDHARDHPTPSPRPRTNFTLEEGEEEVEISLAEGPSADVLKPGYLEFNTEDVDDYTTDGPDYFDYDYGDNDPPLPELIPSCHGFSGEYYLVQEELTSFQEFEQLTPNVSRVDKWIWFPSGGPCAWDLPWPAITENELVAIFSGQYRIENPGIYRFQVNTGASANLRMFVDGQPVIALPAIPGTCRNGMPVNQGEIELTDGDHYIQIFFQRSANDTTVGLEVYVAAVPTESGAEMKWSPLGGAEVSTTNPTRDNGRGCTADYLGYRSCQCYACDYSPERRPCEDYCTQYERLDPGPLCLPEYITNLPTDVLKYVNNWQVESGATSLVGNDTIATITNNSNSSSSVGVDVVDGGEGVFMPSGHKEMVQAEQPGVVYAGEDFNAKVANYDPSASSYNFNWWYSWHECIAPLADQGSPPATPSPNWEAMAPCLLRVAEDDEAGISSITAIKTLGRRQLRMEGLGNTATGEAAEGSSGVSSVASVFQLLGKMVVLVATLALLPRVVL